MGFVTFILGIIFFCIILVLLFVMVVVSRFWNIFRILFGKKPNNNTFYQNFFYNQQRDFRNRGNSNSSFGGNDNAKSSKQTISGQPKQRTSNINKNEGEYVDFEEIE